MDNRLVNATWTYHNGTKHSSERGVRTSAHFLDWPNQPLPAQGQNIRSRDETLTPHALPFSSLLAN